MSAIEREEKIKALTEEEKKLFDKERYNIFKLTIFVCALYAGIALVLLLVALFTTWGKNYLYDKLLPFVGTYIIGTIIIIIYLANMIYNYVPTKIDKSLGYDSQMCPDYWKLVPVDKDALIDNKGNSYFSSNLNQNQFNYKCEIDDKIIDKKKMKELDTSNQFGYELSNTNNLYVKLDNKTNTSGLNKEETHEKYNLLKSYAAIMSGYNYSTNNGLTNMNKNSLKKPDGTFFKDSDPIPLECDKVYPLYLSVMDNENNKDDTNEPTNRFRCAYANACGIAWTEAGCY